MTSIPKEEPTGLVHSEQVKVFNTLAELGRHGITHNLSPQLIVVGDQTTGKSSVLEALARFHFPVSEKLCTRCPIKLILRDSPKETLKVRVELSEDSHRKPQDEDKLRQWVSGFEATKLHTLESLMADASSELGLSFWPDPNTSPIPQVVKQFTEDILVVEKQGPNLPLLNLMDLPGLFQGTSQEQDKASRSAVEHIIKKQVERETNVVLLVVSAKTPLINQSVMRIFQEVEDKGLSDRAIGVVTHPDLAGDQLGEIQKVLLGVEHKLKHGWYVVRNQNKENRENCKSLDDRDQEEKEYFRRSAWQGVPRERKGIENLRAALKNALWFHTQAALPGIMSNIKGKISQIEAEVKNSDHSRATASQRRQYLANIAVKFEHLTTRAINGMYENDPCNESHAIGESRKHCLKCKGFFPVGTKKPDNPDGQRTKLRSNVRALNMEFAKAMRRFGKTEVISQNGLTATAAKDDSRDQGTDQLAKQADWLIPDDALKHYEHDEPKYIDRKQYEKEVAEMIKGSRGREPSGEVNPGVYRDLLIYQSSRWGTIAENHLLAVFKAAKDFVHLAMNDVCPDPNAKVRLSLQEKVIEPNLQGLREKAYQNLKTLLDCRDFGGTAFFDSFGDVFTVQEQARDLEGRLSSFEWDALVPDKVVANIRSGLESLVALSVGPLSVDNHLKNFIIGKCLSVVTQAFSTAGKAPDENAVRAEVDKLYPEEVMHLDAARVVGMVETYYKTTMVAFVGYVNALVVENGILRKLPDAVFSQENMQHADQALIDEIAAEEKDEAIKREENERNLHALKQNLEKLESIRGNK